MDELDHSFGLLPDSGADSRLDAGWADFCTLVGVAPESRNDAAAIAQHIAAATASADRMRAAASTFQHVLDAAGAEAAATTLARLINDVVIALPQPAVQALLSSLEVPERRAFVADAARAVAPTALLKIATAAAAAFGQPLSQPLANLLQKLRTEADELPAHLRERADQSFRALINHLMDAWATSAISAAATGYADIFGERTARGRGALSPEPLRVLQLSLETGAIGSVVWGAVAEQSSDEKGMRQLFDLLKRAPAGSRAAAAIAEQVATPARLTGLLKEEPIDWDAVDVLVQRMGSSAIRPLLEELAEARSRQTRRALMDRLVTFGPEIAPVVNERLSDARWYVVRNMLTLLREAGCPTGQLPFEKFRNHEDSRVRRETLQLQLENAATRDEALTQALQDSDKHVLRTALQAARSALPESAVAVLARRVVDGTFPPEFRVMSLFLLGRSGSPLALDTLLAFAGGGSSIFGKPKLAPKSPEMLAALGGLARSWPNERRAAVLLDIARKSKDEQILNALHAYPGG